MPEQHAKYSPSKLSRIIGCPGSVALTEGIEETESPYAQEGTMLHKVTEVALLEAATEVSRTLALKYKLTEEHIEAVDNILEFVQVLKMAQDGPTQEIIEAKVTLAQYPLLHEVRGTVDYCMYSETSKTLYVVDWKYGKGIEVFPDCDQLKAYAIGAMATFSTYEIEHVVTIIGQPRLYGGDLFKEYDYEPKELIDWLHDILTPAIEAAEKSYQLIHLNNGIPLAQTQIDRLIKKGDIILSPSSSSCQWCRIKATCAARRAAAVSVAEEVFKVYAKLPNKTDPEEVTALLVKAKDLQKYLADLALYVMRQIQQGIDVPRYKMVAGRSNRVWKSEKNMLKYARTLGHVNDDMYIKKIMSPAQAEKVIGAGAKKSTEFKALINKQDGKPTLVLKTDKRKAIEYASAESKFADFVAKS